MNKLIINTIAIITLIFAQIAYSEVIDIYSTRPDIADLSNLKQINNGDYLPPGNYALRKKIENNVKVQSYYELLSTFNNFLKEEGKYYFNFNVNPLINNIPFVLSINLNEKNNLKCIYDLELIKSYNNNGILKEFNSKERYKTNTIDSVNISYPISESYLDKIKFYLDPRKSAKWVTSRNNKDEQVFKFNLNLDLDLKSYQRFKINLNNNFLWLNISFNIDGRIENLNWETLKNNSELIGNNEYLVNLKNIFPSENHIKINTIYLFSSDKFPLDSFDIIGDDKTRFEYYKGDNHYDKKVIESIILNDQFKREFNSDLIEIKGVIHSDNHACLENMSGVNLYGYKTLLQPEHLTFQDEFLTKVISNNSYIINGKIYQPISYELSHNNDNYLLKYNDFKHHGGSFDFLKINSEPSRFNLKMYALDAIEDEFYALKNSSPIVQFSFKRFFIIVFILFLTIGLFKTVLYPFLSFFSNILIIYNTYLYLAFIALFLFGFVFYIINLIYVSKIIFIFSYIILLIIALNNFFQKKFD